MSRHAPVRKTIAYRTRAAYRCCGRQRPLHPRRPKATTSVSATAQAAAAAVPADVQAAAAAAAATRRLLLRLLLSGLANETDSAPSQPGGATAHGIVVASRRRKRARCSRSAGLVRAESAAPFALRHTSCCPPGPAAAAWPGGASQRDTPRYFSSPRAKGSKRQKAKGKGRCDPKPALKSQVSCWLLAILYARRLKD